MAFNRDIGESEWQKVERVNVFDYDGDMIRLKTKHLDVLSTPDHRWVVTKPNKISKLNKTEVLTSDELYNSDKPYAIPIRAPHNNQVKARYSDVYVAFLGWYLTDGYLKNGNIVRICQSNTANPHKVDIIDSIMEELGVEFSRREKNQVIWEIRDPEFVYKLNRLVPERKLNMKLLTRLTNPQLSILLENMRLGDGWSIWATGDKTQGELLQALVVLCNNTSSMYELSHEGDLSYFKDKKPSKYGQEFVRATKTSYGVKFSNFRKSVNTKNTYNSENNLTKEKYVGKVWCPTVKSGAFFTRVIGEDKRYRTLITGNCQSAASDMCLFGSILIYSLHQFHNDLREEFLVGSIPRWKESSQFVEEESDNSYECYLDGEYCENHFSIALEQRALPLSPAFCRSTAELYRAECLRDDFREHIENCDDFQELSDTQKETLLRSPDLPQRITNQLEHSCAYGEAYWQVVSDVARTLLKELRQQSAEQSPC